MAQSTILAAGVTAATSTDIVVAAGQTVNVGIFGASGARLPGLIYFPVVIVTPDAPMQVSRIGLYQPVMNLVGPGTFRVNRPAYEGQPFGVFLNDAS